MIFKEGVKIKGIKPELLAGLIVADGIWKQFGEVLVVTSVVDSKHIEDSLHPSGYGGDLRTHYFPSATTIKFAAQLLRDALTDEFDVVVEPDHIHIEFDPK